VVLVAPTTSSTAVPPGGAGGVPSSIPGMPGMLATGCTLPAVAKQSTEPATGWSCTPRRSKARIRRMAKDKLTWPADREVRVKVGADQAGTVRRVPREHSPQAPLLTPHLLPLT
jgi:hypothetical protein